MHGSSSGRTQPRVWLLLAAAGAVGPAAVHAAVADPRTVTLEVSAAWAIGCLAGLLGVAAARRLPTREAAVWVLLVAALTRGLVLPMADTLSTDFNRYLWDGRESLAARSPYAATPDASAAADPPSAEATRLLHGMNSRGFRSVYPPVSQAAFAAAWSLGGGTLDGGVAALRLIFGSVDLAAVGVLLLVLRRLGRHPGWAILYAWHPLPAVEAVGGMHTEALLTLPLIAAVGLVLPRRPVEPPRSGSGATAAAAPPRAGAEPACPPPAAALAGLCIAVAAAVKLFPIAAAAVLAARLRGRARWALLSAATAAGVALLWPLLGPPHGAGVRASLALYAGYFHFNNPLFVGLQRVALAGTGDPTLSAQIASRLLLAVFGGVASAVLWRAWRGRDAARIPGLLAALFGAYLLLSPTVHPWYLMGVLWLVPLTRVGRPALLWLAATVPLTHLAYDPTLPAWGVPGWVMTIEWGGVAVLLLFHDARPLWIGPLMRARAEWKAARLSGFLPEEGRLLDVGCGEGLVTAALARRTGLTAVGVDVDAEAGAAAPVLACDGRRLPFRDGAFDAATVLTVLHHCDDPEAVLAEAVRVVRPGGRLLVAESVYRTAGGLWLLTRLDRFFNGLRGGGRDGLAGPLRFAREQVWAGRFAAAELVPAQTRHLSRGLHRHVLFVLDRPGRV
ncbi:class I SAM-dependent methyltransferase [Phycisphaera mikurensis]|uniref:Methyltransferase type 11 domain-containing protein n=1 Tax=Phycisphaera mikurensis (strain NBRC 102666 / KCTC 22515 / FYK2301M01) TaxID=1142394 RepID=I0IIX3_PHYMF|nr:class I SAM-dependent methyltransferase [Phycisphaera mikurensis]MBB6443404.1 SAM-dependent methyltransferase [Phycisphaera mikurensis]BAM05211.1 hypothetical protein PSMK_30520 [Phycisphaera mikurensis NBRC 102666]